MLYRHRDKFNSFSVKVGIWFARAGLSPNQWTLLSIVPIAVAFYYLITDQFLKAAAFFIVGAFLDVVDGSVARVTGRVSKRGAFLDTLVDRYVEGAIIFGLLLARLPRVYGPPYAWIFLLLFGALMTTYVKAAAKEKDLTEREIKGSLLEHTDRMLILFLGILAAEFWGKELLSWLVIILAVLTNLSALQRIAIVWRKAKERHFWQK